MPARNPRRRRRPPPRRPGVRRVNRRRPAPPRRPPPPDPPPAPPAAQPRERGRPGDNTTCDVYFAPNVPPAAADVAAVPCHLAARFEAGSESSEGDQDFRWTHLLHVGPAVDLRDSYPAAPANRVYVPDKDGTGFDVVFVELVNRGTPAAYKRVFLDRRTPSFPTDQL